MNLEAFGRRLVRARKLRGHTQFSICNAIGIASPMAVSKWERGISAPSSANLVALSKALNVPLAWLTTGKGPSPLAEVA